MSYSIPERDWKYLRTINRDMLNTLCLRINKQSETIIQNPDKTEHEKYGKLYKHIHNSDKIIADGFDDWRRSKIWLKIAVLIREELLTDEHIENLSDETQERIQNIKTALQED
ncbi:MAG: hypothetical protein PF692_02595 [Kiritimatiellae bacterium]|jgi:hypothetical protein|nr:hypothetical protein [Kiritimatiellia bacterium]